MQLIYRTLRDPQEAIALRAFGALVLLVGVGVGSYWGYVCTQRLASFNRPVYTTSVRGWGDVFYGGTYIAIVDGQEIECTGGDESYSQDDRVLVVYDLDSPTHCRRADKVGKLSVWEWMGFVRTIYFVLIGIFILTVRENDHSRRRKVFNRVCLVAAFGLLVIDMYFALTVTGI